MIMDLQSDVQFWQITTAIGAGTTLVAIIFVVIGFSK